MEVKAPSEKRSQNTDIQYYSILYKCGSLKSENGVEVKVGGIAGQ